MISKTAIKLVAIVLLGSVPACGGDYVPYPDQPEDWRAEPQACARFWDKHFSAAIQGSPSNAEFLYIAVAENKLVPPARDPENYSQRQKDFDLLALMRLSINEFVPTHREAPALGSLRRGVRLDSRVYFDPAIHDPQGVQINALRRAEDYVGHGWRDYPPGDGICAKRTRLSHLTDEWSAACRQILADDGVLPSTEDFVVTIPENTRACGYEG